MEMQIVTQQEKDKLQQELKTMIDRRPTIATAIAEAREKGDLKENADYHAARDEYALNESRIKSLEQRIKNLTVVDSSSVPEDMVFLGSIVKVKDLESGDTDTFRIVGEVGKLNLDSDITEVSAKSPLGESLVRARVGDTVTVNLAKATIRYEILALLDSPEDSGRSITPSVLQQGFAHDSEGIATLQPIHIEGPNGNSRIEVWTVDHVPFNKPTDQEKQIRAAKIRTAIWKQVSELKPNSKLPVRHAIFGGNPGMGNDVENLLFENLGVWKDVSANDPVIRFERYESIAKECPKKLSGPTRFYYCYQRSQLGAPFPFQRGLSPLVPKAKLPLGKGVSFESSKWIWLAVARAIQSAPNLFMEKTLEMGAFGTLVRLGVPRAANLKPLRIKALFDGTLSALHFCPSDDCAQLLASELGMELRDEVRMLMSSKKNKMLGQRNNLVWKSNPPRLSPRDDNLVQGELVFELTSDKEFWLELQILGPA
jgi:transcription elongation factor GreA